MKLEQQLHFNNGIAKILSKNKLSIIKNNKLHNTSVIQINRLLKYKGIGEVNTTRKLKRKFKELLLKFRDL